MKIELFTACSEDELPRLKPAFEAMGIASGLPMFESREDEIADRDLEKMAADGCKDEDLFHIKITIEVEDKNEETANVA